MNFLVIGMALWKTLFGYTWAMATHIEDISPEELKRRIFEYSMSKSE